MNSLNSNAIIERYIPIFMLIAGAGISVIWLLDIFSGKFSKQGNFFKWKEGENRLWPHIFIEFLTSISLVAGAIGLFLHYTWALSVVFLAFGALIYSTVNSTGWVLGNKKRLLYGIPMWLSLLGVLICIYFLLV